MPCSERIALLGLFPLKRMAVPVMMTSGPPMRPSQHMLSRHQFRRYIR